MIIAKGKPALIRDHAERVISLRDSIKFYQDTINYWNLRRQRGISGAGLKSLSIEKAIDRLERLDERLKAALKNSEAIHDAGDHSEFQNYSRIASWVETNERQLNALKVSQRKRVNVFEFSYELLDAIKDRVSIVDMIDELKIKKRRSGGGRYVVICPFHDEDTPSCMIYVNQDKYHCFGCQASGDVIDFYQGVLEIEFDEAMTRLCEKLQIQVMDAEKVESADKIIEYYKTQLAEVEEALKEENINFAKELQNANNN